MTVNEEISVDLEYLIGVVQDAFYSSEEFRKKAKKQSWKRTTDVNYMLRHLSDVENEKWGAVREICRVMGFDQDRLVSIARLARKWKIKHDWQLCFPVSDHAEKIFGFITVTE